MEKEDIRIIQNNGFDKVNAGFAFFVFILTFVVYYLTKAPTFSFWDCGEFVACSYILGIPHPPGSPLYIIIGRLFSILPIAADIGTRINLLSVVTSSVAALFGYLSIVRLIHFWYSDRNDIYNRVTVYIGGLTGALFMAFSSTNWANSVEAEVYAPTIMIMTIIFWLALKYFENKETNSGTRYVILLIYLAIMGVGIHLTLYLVMPILGLFFILKKESGIREWAVISLFFLAELYLLYQLSSRPGEVPYYVPILILFIVFLFHAILLYKKSQPIIISIVLFLVALYPLYFEIIGAISKNLTGRSLASSMESISGLPIGWIGFAGLIVWGLYSVYKYFVVRAQGGDMEEWLIPAVYSLAPALLLGIGQTFSGYKAFLFLTLLSILLVALFLWKHINWLMLIGLGAVSLVILGFWQFFYGMIFGAIAIIIVGLLLKDKSWKTALSIILLAIIGYSVHLYIPIRSSHNPNIDENNPSQSTTAFINYLERKQYGNISMTERMFDRRAEWSNQFGDYRRMGFWGFFKDQYGLTGPRFFIILILGLFGIWETIRRKPDIGLPFLVLIILASVGLVLYMNFADGTRINPVSKMDYLEVRDRDYFFTPAFVFFGLAIGLGIAAFIDLIRDTFSKSSAGIKKLSFGLSSLLVLMPLFPLANNYFINDRSRNYMPFDYASNILKCCDKDAILITGGDNDTFPLWCIQEVYGIRKDVRVVNLSLANMGWYTKQLRDIFKVPITLTDEQIDRLRPYRDNDGVAFRIQNQIVDHIITANQWKYPIYFIVSAGQENFRYKGKSILENLVLEGLTMRLVGNKDESELNYERTAQLYEEEFVYRGVNDSTIYKNETTSRITGNYAQGFLYLADSLKRAKDFDGAFGHIREALKILPKSEDIYSYSAQILGEMDRKDTMQAFIENAPVANKEKLYLNWALAAKTAGRLDESIEILEETHRVYPDYVEAFRSLVTIYYRNKFYSRLRVVVSDWVERHPEDLESKQLLKQIQNVDPVEDTLEGSN